MTQLKHLFSPIMIGSVEVKNRIIRPGIISRLGEHSMVTPRLKAFYEARARGGVGLIVTGSIEAIDVGQPRHGGLAIHSDAFIPGFKELVKVVHQGGAKLALQISPMPLWAAGKGAPTEMVGPSDVMVNPRGGKKPRPLTVDEIKQVTILLGDAARRAREAGFDLVEFHIGIGNLVNQFTSPYTNRRTDAYGGSLENRLRFFLDILAECKKKAGSDYTIMTRVSGADMMEGGHTVEDTARVAVILEKAGIAAIDVTTGWHEAPVLSFQSPVPRGEWIHMAETIRKGVKIPVVTGTRVPDPVLADRIIAEGKADMVYMARPLIADPELPNKAREGNFHDIRFCIACSHCFERAVVDEEPIACTVNAQAGREAEYSIEPAREPKKVFVIGGGPAGMEAARVAALRGHKVTLAEKEDHLGGQLLVASVASYKNEIAGLTSYLSGQMKKLGVEVKLKEKVTAATVQQMKPDVVIVATGTIPVIPDIPGAKGQNVVMALDVLSGAKRTGPKVVVVGGGMVGCEVADFLAAKGKEVTILEMQARVGDDLPRGMRWVVMQLLRDLKLGMEANITVEEITESGVRAVRDGQSIFFDADTVVLAVGLKPENALLMELEGKVPALYAIGDCTSTQRLHQAIESGFRVAREI